jgi:hypothetical protein
MGPDLDLVDHSAVVLSGKSLLLSLLPEVVVVRQELGLKES